MCNSIPKLKQLQQYGIDKLSQLNLSLLPKSMHIWDRLIVCTNYEACFIISQAYQEKVEVISLVCPTIIHHSANCTMPFFKTPAITLNVVVFMHFVIPWLDSHPPTTNKQVKFHVLTVTWNQTLENVVTPTMADIKFVFNNLEVIILAIFFNALTSINIINLPCFNILCPAVLRQ